MNALIMGSAPEARTWFECHWSWFEPDHQLICFNNSWCVPDRIEQITWYHQAADHARHGTKIMTPEQLACVRTHTHRHVDDHVRLYRDPERTTMLFNVLLFHIHRQDYNNIRVVACDMQYRREGDTFYSDEPGSRARNDPLNTLGASGITRECDNVIRQANTRGTQVTNASTKVSRLTLDRFTDHLR